MKTVLILYNKTANLKSEIGTKKFESLYKYARKKNVTLCRAAISSFNKKTRLFNDVQFFEKKWSLKKNIRPDLVFDKTPFYLNEALMKSRRIIAKHYPFYNELDLSKLLSNKWLTYVSFKNFSPKAFLISKKEELKKVNKLSSSRVIFKPLIGSGGKGIKIFNRSSFMPIKYPFIAQELLELKGEIKNFVRGAHDLRIMIINERPFYSFLRIPKKNSLVSNLSRGGKIKVIELENLPETVLPFIKKVQKKLKSYKIKIYSIDLMLDDNKTPWIIEINSRPGILLEKQELPYKKYFFDNLINFFIHAK
jgi:glutathione synthase/RimK-type ligase-like ATP-grasp enzyme